MLRSQQHRGEHLPQYRAPAEGIQYHIHPATPLAERPLTHVRRPNLPAAAHRRPMVSSTGIEAVHDAGHCRRIVQLEALHHALGRVLGDALPGAWHVTYTRALKFGHMQSGAFVTRSRNRQVRHSRLVERGKQGLVILDFQCSVGNQQRRTTKAAETQRLEVAADRLRILLRVGHRPKQSLQSLAGASQAASTGSLICP